jgi:hypothetical protein
MARYAVEWRAAIVERIDVLYNDLRRHAPRGARLSSRLHTDRMLIDPGSQVVGNAQVKVKTEGGPK